MGGSMLLTRRAYAYVNHGRWIADCPFPDCGNAEKLQPRQSTFYCTNCRFVGDVVWPGDADGIDAALSQRPVPQTRNWAPGGHRQAVSSGFPSGQSVADLWAENV